MKTTPPRQSSNRPEDERESGDDDSCGQDLDNKTNQKRGQKRDLKAAFKGPFKYIDNESDKAMKALVSQRNGFPYQFFCQYVQEKNCHLYKSVCAGSTRLSLAWKDACKNAAAEVGDEDTTRLLGILGERDTTSLFITYCQRVKGKQLVNLLIIY